MRNRSRHLDGEQEIVGRALSPFRICGRRVRAMERRVDLRTSEQTCVALQVRSDRVEARGGRARNRPAGCADSNVNRSGHAIRTTALWDTGNMAGAGSLFEPDLLQASTIETAS